MLRTYITIALVAVGVGCNKGDLGSSAEVLEAELLFVRQSDGSFCTDSVCITVRECLRSCASWRIELKGSNVTSTCLDENSAVQQTPCAFEPVICTAHTDGNDECVLCSASFGDRRQVYTTCEGAVPECFDDVDDLGNACRRCFDSRTDRLVYDGCNEVNCTGVTCTSAGSGDCPAGTEPGTTSCCANTCVPSLQCASGDVCTSTEVLGAPQCEAVGLLTTRVSCCQFACREPLQVCTEAQKLANPCPAGWVHGPGCVCQPADPTDCRVSQDCPPGHICSTDPPLSECLTEPGCTESCGTGCWGTCQLDPGVSCDVPTIPPGGTEPLASYPPNTPGQCVGGDFVYLPGDAYTCPTWMCQCNKSGVSILTTLEACDKVADPCASEFCEEITQCEEGEVLIPPGHDVFGNCCAVCLPGNSLCSQGPDEVLADRGLTCPSKHGSAFYGSCSKVVCERKYTCTLGCYSWEVCDDVCAPDPACKSDACPDVCDKRCVTP